MEKEKALTILGLTGSSSTTELNTVFRKLAKKYHPDFNRENEAWAHKMMTELNLAYELALEYLTSLSAITEKVREQSSEVNFISIFNQAINRVLQGIFKYYQYGLENVHLRKEGVRKIRYRDSLTDMKKGIVNLEVLKSSAENDRAQENLEVFIDFTRAFLMNMLIEKYYIPSGTSFENNAHKHYYNGCVLLDNAIKEVVFGDLLIRVRDSTFSNKIDISYEEFMVVITRYNGSNWIPETLLKVYLLEVFTKVIRLFRKMRY